MEKQIHKYYIKIVESYASLSYLLLLFDLWAICFIFSIIKLFLFLLWDEEIIVTAWFTRVINPLGENNVYKYEMYN